MLTKTWCVQSYLYLFTPGPDFTFHFASIGMLSLVVTCWSLVRRKHRQPHWSDRSCCFRATYQLVNFSSFIAGCCKLLLMVATFNLRLPSLPTMMMLSSQQHSWWVHLRQQLQLQWFSSHTKMSNRHTNDLAKFEVVLWVACSPVLPIPLSVIEGAVCVPLP